MTDFTLLALLVAGFISLVLAGEEDCYCSQCTRVLAPGVQPVLLGNYTVPEENWGNVYLVCMPQCTLTRGCTVISVVIPAAPRPQPYCEFYADTPVTFISQHYDDVDLFPIYSELFKGNCEKDYQPDIGAHGGDWWVTLWDPIDTPNWPSARARRRALEAQATAISPDEGTW